MADTTAPEASVWIVGEMPDGVKILSNDNSGADESEVWREDIPEEKSTLLDMDMQAGEAVIGWYAEPEPYTAAAPVEVESPEEDMAEGGAEEDEMEPAAVAAAVTDEMLTEIESSLDGYESLVTELLMAQMEDERFADEEDAKAAAVSRPAPAAQHARVAAAAREFMDSINSAVTAAADMKDKKKDYEEAVASEDVPMDDSNAAMEADRLAKKKAKDKKLAKADMEAEVAAVEDEEGDMPPADDMADDGSMPAEDDMAEDDMAEDDMAEGDAEDADERLVSIRDRMSKLEEAITRLMTMGQQDAEIEEPDVSEEDSTVDERDMEDM